jgi:hypothetical protein
MHSATLERKVKSKKQGIKGRVRASPFAELPEREIVRFKWK